MKLILTHEVTGLGHPGDVVNVKDGYARNFLLPNGKAIAWSVGGEKQIEGIRRARALVRSATLIMQKRLRQSLNQQILLLRRRLATPATYSVQ